MSAVAKVKAVNTKVKLVNAGLWSADAKKKAVNTKVKLVNEGLGQQMQRLRQ